MSELQKVCGCSALLSKCVTLHQHDRAILKKRGSLGRGVALRSLNCFVNTKSRILWGCKGYCCRVGRSCFCVFCRGCPRAVWGAILQNGRASSLCLVWSWVVGSEKWKQSCCTWLVGQCLRKKAVVIASFPRSKYAWSWKDGYWNVSAHVWHFQAGANCFPNLCMQICSLYACSFAPIGILLMTLLVCSLSHLKTAVVRCTSAKGATFV